jgi:hypothetical protein
VPSLAAERAPIGSLPFPGGQDSVARTLNLRQVNPELRPLPLCLHDAIFESAGLVV